jgi:hypothetical protein
LDLSGQLLPVIERGSDEPLPEAEFNALALEVFAYQFERGAIYRGFCTARGALPGTVQHWTAIPAVPVDAFRAAPLVAGDSSHVTKVFRTSGTTGGLAARGEHHLLDTGLYKAALRQGFRRALLPRGDRLRILALVPPPEEVPDSSLSFMLGDVIETLGSGASDFFAGANGLRVGDLLSALESAIAADEAVLIAGTSFSYVHLLDELASRGLVLRLPEGSRAMDTGGFKGRSRTVARDELYTGIQHRLGIPLPMIVNEYGMTEMSSQFYDGVAGHAPGLGEPRFHRGPGWVRSVAVDPESLAPLPAGEAGILRHLDLANLYSVAALQTSDWGTITDLGIELAGRAPGATPRGCSLALEELLQRIGMKTEG